MAALTEDRQFFFGPSDASHASTSSPVSANASADSEADDLPYPAPLSSSAFLGRSFDPIDFLSHSRPRHQTLEDLRSDLAYRSKSLDRELLEFVDEHYRDFVVLGSGLGDGIGSESLEGVRVGLLGWEKEVRGLAGKVRVRRLEVEGAVDELREVRRQRSLAMKLVQLQSRIEDLELRLKIERLQGETGDDEDMFPEEDEDIPGDGQEENEAASKLDSLTGLVEDYEELDSLTSDASISSHPFAKLQRSRIRSIRKSLVQRLEDSENASPKKTGYDSSLLDIRSLLARIQRDPD